MKYTRFLALFLALLPVLSMAQNNELINSGEVIKTAVNFIDSGKYKQAIPMLEKINRSDTNYVWSLYEKAVSFEADSQYTAAIKCCREALAQAEQREYEPDLLNTYGNTLNEMGEHDKAIQVFDMAIDKFPAYPLFYFNKGIVYMTVKKPADAEPWFKKALLINPYLYSAHYQLGLAALQQGKIVPAFLSFTGYLTVNPAGRYFAKSVQLLSAIAKSTDDILDLKNKRTTPPDENYQAVEDILLSKIALDPAYKPIISLDDPISRQIQAVFEKLDYSDTNNDFWIQYYLPYFKQVFTPKQFELFIFHIFSNANADFIQNYLKKNKKEQEVFVTAAGVYFDQLRATRELNFKKRDEVTEKYLYEDGRLAGKGTLANNGKILTGPWIAYYGAGTIKVTGTFTATGERDGEWLYYGYAGQMLSRVHYLDGKLEGKQEYYYDNGNPSSVENFVNNKAEGLVTTYYFAGNLKSTVNYQVGKKEGEEKEYFSNGSLRSVDNYLHDALNGYTREYYKTGGVKEVEQYTNGKSDGPYKSYYESGGVESEGQFVNDNAAGEWKYYYQSGKLKETHSYVNGYETGLHQEYYENGQLAVTYQSKKAKTDGESISYYKDGKVLAKCFYQKSTIQSAKYFDEAGNQLSTSAQKDGMMDIVIYSINGVKKEHAFYDQKGSQQGADTIFYPSGKIDQVNHYRNDTLNGPSVTYYFNGNKKFEINMAGGKDNGYYRSYFVSGKLESKGWLKNGDYQGEWLYYDNNGTLTTRAYYLDNDLDGYKEEYFPDGKETLEEKYYRGWLLKMTQYNDVGNVIRVDSFPKESGKYTLLYPGGQVMAQGMYVNGDMDGLYKTFFFDGSVESISFYKKGMLDSTYRSFHYGGLKDDEGQYFRNEKSGTWKYYDDDGKLFSATEYKNGDQNGAKTYYDPSGTVDYISMYEDDQLEGDSKQFDTDGTLAYQLNYHEGDAVSYTYIGKDGKLVAQIPIAYNNGTLKTYYPNGKPSRECTYSDGQANGKNMEYYGNGQVMLSETASYGRSEDKYTQYYPNGKIRSEYNYIDDDADGMCREFDENGVLKREMTYEDGAYNGPFKIYDKNGKLAKTLTYYYGKLIAAKNE